MTRCPGSDQKLSVEGLQGMTCCPGSDWTHTPKTSFGGLKTISHCPGSDWNSAQKLSFEGCLANFAAMRQCRRFITHPCDFCDPQRKLFIHNDLSLCEKRGNNQIDGHICTRHLWPFTPQGLAEEFHSEQALQYRTQAEDLGWNFVQNLPPITAQQKHGGAATWSLSTCIRCISRFSTTATATGDFSDDGVNSSPPTRRKGQWFYSHQARGL